MCGVFFFGGGGTGGYRRRAQVQVLNEELAKPLRQMMYKDQYTDALLAACFQGTVDAAKVMNRCFVYINGCRRGTREESRK